MKQFVALLGIVSLAFAAPGKFLPRTAMGGRIIGGVEANIKDLPYQIALLINGTQFCGAAIIGAETILTAAHCVVPSVLPNVNLLSFRVGSSKWREGGERIAAKKLIIHELYKDCETCFDYDIAIVKLARKIKVSFAVPIPLAKEKETFPDGTLATVSGWGTTIFNVSAYPETFRRVDLPLVNPTTCRSAYGSIITERFICAGFSTGGKDACQGDSGGPLAIGNKLIGIVAFGDDCADPDFPGVYSSVAEYRDWIRTNSGI